MVLILMVLNLSAFVKLRGSSKALTFLIDTGADVSLMKRAHICELINTSIINELKGMGERSRFTFQFKR